MRLSRLLAVVVAAAGFAAVAPSADAATDYLIRADGISRSLLPTGGGTAQPLMYTQIDSFSMGGEQPTITQTSTGLTGGRMAFTDLTVEKPVDDLSPMFLQRLAQGAVIPAVEVIARHTGEAEPFARYCFQTAMLRSQKQTGGDGDGPRETLTFAFTTMA